MGLLDFLVKSANSQSEAYTTLLKEEAEVLEKRLDAYIYHEHLEEINEPVYFHEFVRRADAAGLRYLADASVSSMVAQSFDESTAKLLGDVPLLRREQYMDFLRSRMFRSSLLGRQNLKTDYRAPVKSLEDLHVSLRQPLAAETANDGTTVWRRKNGQLTTEMPITTTVEQLNDRFPGWVPVKELVDQVKDEAWKGPLREALLTGFIKGFFHLALDPPSVCHEIHEKPKCTPLSRFQAKQGKKITNRLHTDWSLQPQQQYLVEHLDGTRTVEDLAEMLQSEVSQRHFQVIRDGETVTPNVDQCAGIVQTELGRLCALAMLVE